MSYIDGFVIPVPATAKEAYREMAARVVPIFKEYGATRLVEYWGDDLPDGKITDFKRAGRRRRTRMSSFRGWSGPRRRCATRPARSS